MLKKGPDLYETTHIKHDRIDVYIKTEEIEKTTQFLIQANLMTYDKIPRALPSFPLVP